MSTRTTSHAAIGLLALLLLSSRTLGQDKEEWLAAGDSLLIIGEVQEAEKAYRRGLGRDGGVMAKIGIARTRMARGKWTDAGRQLDEILDADSLNLLAHYLRGICHREYARIGTPTEERNERRAAQHFSLVARHDSLFQDVLYQMALQHFFDGNREEAMRLALRQVALKPDEPEGQVGLFRLLRLMLNGKKSPEALSWLRAHPSDVTEFFTAEVYRQDGKDEVARQRFESLLARPGKMLPQPIYLALARLHFSRNRPEEGQRYVDQAVREITSPAAAWLVMEDFKYLASDAELAAWFGCDEPAEWIRFFEDFWYRREPLPSSGLRVRLAEHYRRLHKAERDHVYRGVRSWHQLPDQSALFAFPAAYYLNEALNDKGLIYVRHGDPSEAIVTVGGMEDSFIMTPDQSTSQAGIPRDVNLVRERGAVESWRYESPRMEFHFMRGAVANGWFLTPTVSGLKAFEDREHWGGSYARAASVLRAIKREQSGERMAPGVAQQTGSGDSTGPAMVFVSPSQGDRDRTEMQSVPELLELRDRLTKASRESVALGLTSDRHTWTAAVEPIEMPHQVAAFRGEGGKTRLELHYALPLGVVSKAAEDSADQVEVEVGLSLHDALWHPVEQSLEVKRLPKSQDVTAAVFDFLSVAVPPDSFQVAFHARTLAGRQVAGYRTSLRLSAFPNGEAGMSDILAAYRIKPALQPSRFNRHGLHLSVNPFGRFRVSDPVFVYFELYDLRQDADGSARFSVEYTLVPTARPKGLRRLFGSDTRPSLSLRFDRVSLEDSPVEHAEIDVARVAPGEYRLEVTVRQGTTTEPLRRSISLRLTE